MSEGEVEGGGKMIFSFVFVFFPLVTLKSPAGTSVCRVPQPVAVALDTLERCARHGALLAWHWLHASFLYVRYQFMI